jgi:glucosamine-phosphate N-acetyltransferase
MENIKYVSLINIIDNFKEYTYDLYNVKDEYLKVLSNLSKVEYITNEIFYTIINEISSMGDIIVCYYKENNKIRIIGTGTIIIEPKIIHGGKNVGHIEDLVVDNEYRNKGIGKTILNKLIEIGKDKHCYKIILNCDKDIKEFYEKNGFENKNIEMSLYLLS